ncbi:unnamed protein product [Pseudo-nitzschia multistriata]|uniref:Uncharacterized protein n=1 Tax=Pseudo-nitzschia multistriata TaxID=183589 RepID=A0A448ZGY5_9STRA|nr:unnamed protein product [Pseudo-nitzschia multistriata]
MVEVSLVEGANAVQKQKSCWFPFKNHMKNRKSITAGPGPGPKMVANNWDVDGLDISDNKNRYNTEHNKSQRFHRNNAKTKGSSVSTGTITDTSFQSEESPGGTRSYNSSHDSSSRSKASSSRNTSANFSYQSNSNSILENSHHRNEHGDELELEDPYFLDEDFDDDGSIVANDRYANPKKKQQSTEQRLGDALPVPDMDLDLATLETNCSTKEFWVDEMVEGGAFSCLQEREKVSNSNDTKLNESEDSGASTTNGYPDLSRDSEESIGTITHPLGRIMRFVSQDPEDSNDGAPLRRVLCSAISLRNGHNPMLCRNREETRRQDEQNPTTTKVWKENQIGTIVNHHDEEAPNFFVEVEARREHLDGVRELEEIQAENDEFEEDIAIARTASLVDEDSAFMESSNGGMNRNNVLKHAFLPPLGQSDNSETFSLSSKKLVKNIISGAKATNNESKNLQSMDSSVSFDNGNIASRLPIMNSDQGNRDFQREKMDRQDKLMSEMVTDRVLAMQVDNGIISDSILRDKDEFMITQTECKLRDDRRHLYLY